MASLSSIAAYEEVLARLLAPNAARNAVRSWLDGQMALIDDMDFAQRFEMHFGRYDAAPGAYTPRLVTGGACDLLGGIRFYGGDGERPFVHVCAFDEGPGIEKLKGVVAREWADFRPRAMRLLCTEAMDRGTAHVDQSIHAQRADAMPGPRTPVVLVPVSDPAEAQGIVDGRYRELRRIDAELAAEVYQSDLDTLGECREKGTLNFVQVDDERAGVIATWPDSVEFIDGHVIVEEVIATQFSGRGLATAAQGALARTLAAEDPDTLLIGTIHRDNHSSRISAERAGRPALLHYVFVELQERVRAVRRAAADHCVSPPSAV